jgi:flavin-dependent dehydrogenase
VVDRCAVAIIGAGPAGVSTAIELVRQKVATVLIADIVGPVFPSAETLSPNTKRELRDLGVSESSLAQIGTPCYGIEAAWGTSTPVMHSSLVEPYGHGWHTDARLLRTTLLGIAQSAGVRVIRGRCAGIDNAAPWHVNVQTNQGAQRIHSSFVVDATGRTASVARMLGARVRRLDSMVALVAVLDAASPATTLAVEAVSNGWWYCNPCPGKGALTGFVTDADLARSCGAANAGGWLKQLAQTSFISQRVRPQQNVHHIQVGSCASAILDRLAGDQWLAVGDAAAAVDPLSSQGISKALASGKQAALAIAASLFGDGSALSTYTACRRVEHRAYLSARTGNYLLEHRWAAEAFWLRRRSSEGAPSRPSTLTMPATTHYGA